MVELVLRHAPDFKAETVEMRASSKRQFFSVTCTVRATSKAQLDALYRGDHCAPVGEDGAVSAWSGFRGQI